MSKTHPLSLANRYFCASARPVKLEVRKFFVPQTEPLGTIAAETGLLTPLTCRKSPSQPDDVMTSRWRFMFQKTITLQPNIETRGTRSTPIPVSWQATAASSWCGDCNVLDYRELVKTAHISGEAGGLRAVDLAVVLQF